MKIILIRKDGRQQEIPVRDSYGCLSVHNLDELETIIIDLEKGKGGLFPIHFVQKEN